MFFVWFITFALVFGLFLFGLPLLAIYGLAQARIFWSLVGTSKYRLVRRGETVVDVIHDVPGYKLDDQKRFIKGIRPIYPIESITGAQWTGLYPFRRVKTFEGWEWEEFSRLSKSVDEKDQKNNAEPAYGSISRKKDIFEFYRQFTYSVDLKGVELGGGMGETIRADMRVIPTIWVLDPIKFHESNKDPVSALYARIRASVRGWGGNKDFSVIKATVDSGDHDPSGFSESLQKLNGVSIVNSNPNYDGDIDEDGIFNLLGIVIIQASLENLDAVGAAVDALEAKKLEMLRGDAQIAAAQKAAEVNLISADNRVAVAQRDALAQRTLNEQNAGYYASLPGGDRMFVAAQIAADKSDVTTWVERGADVGITLPLPAAPNKPEIPKKS